MLKKEDLALICLLRKDARIRAKEASKILRMPTSTVYEKIKNTGKLISRFTCILNHEAWGNFLHAFVIMKVGGKDKVELQKELELCNNVNLLWRINNGYDFLVEFVFPTLFAFEAYRESLESRYLFKNCEVYFMIDELKRESFLPFPPGVEQNTTTSDDVHRAV